MNYVRLGFWFLTACYWVGMAVLTHLPPRDVPHTPVNDKVQHFLAYAALAGFLALTVWVTFPSRPRLIWVVLVIGLAYGFIDEQTQKLVGRSCDLKDWVADAFGTMAGVLSVLVLRRFVHLPIPPHRSCQQAGLIHHPTAANG